MKARRKTPLRILWIPFLFATATSWSQETRDDLIPIIKKELDREMSAFKTIQPAPYFIAYRIGDVYSATTGASFGSIIESRQDHHRTLRAEVRVGGYEFDNTHIGNHQYPGEAYFNFFPGGSSLPLENQDKAIRHEVWQATQDAYRNARQSWQVLQGNQKDSLSAAGDFSREKAETFVDVPLADFATIYNEGEWQERVKQLTLPFAKNPDLLDGRAMLRVQHERNYFISSEGTTIAQNRTSAYFILIGAIRTSDGDFAPLHLSYFAFKPSELPSNEKILADIKEMMDKLVRLQKAPRAEPYTGPAILYSRAAGVFFHEIFGHRIEGHRLKDKMDAQTFKGMLETQVLPKNLSVISDPTRAEFGGHPLSGHYQYDDEGVKAQNVTLVNKGILQTFLMSRSPVDKLAHSNGHGRAESGASPVSRQSNLIVQNSHPVAMKDLRKMLISECKKQGKPYGYLFMDVTGGFTMTNRFTPNAFNIFPTEVYRIYTNGQPDELVHGVNLIGTPLAMFAEIKAADDMNEIFAGFCGAESGNVPVTAISPSIFVNRIETQKRMQAEIEEPILPPPPTKE